MNNYTFSLELNSEDGPEDFYSIWIDNGGGTSAEVAGRISRKRVGIVMLAAMNQLTQEQVRDMYGLKS